MKAILHVLEHDFATFFRYRFWLAGLVSMNLADLFIMAVVYNKMVSTEVGDYFRFFSPGITILALFAAAFMIGREVNFELRRNFSHYLLSLPMKRWELATGRILAGGLRGMLYMAPLLLTTFIFLGLPNPLQLVVILTALFLISTGTSGLSIALAVSTKSFEKFVTSRGVVYYLLFFCSTVFYPFWIMQDLAAQGVLPQPLMTLAERNPLSSGADLIRCFLIPNYQRPFSIDLVLNVFVFSSIFTLGAALAYIRIIERE